MLLPLVLAAVAGSFPGGNGLLVYTRATADEGYAVATVKPDGTDPELVTEGSSPAWSADGRRIVFQRDTVDLDLYVISADGSGERRLALPGSDEFLASWSPGRQIVYTADPDTEDDTISPSAEIYTVRDDGTHRRRLTRDHVAEDSPVWSPNGRWIAYAREGGQPTIYLVRPDGTHRRKLVVGDAPSWSPDGKRLTFTRATESTAADIFVLTLGARRARRIVSGPRGRPHARVVTRWDEDRVHARSPERRSTSLTPTARTWRRSSPTRTTHSARTGSRCPSRARP